MYSELLVGRQLELRVADLHVDVAAVLVVGLDQQQVALEHVLAVGAGEVRNDSRSPSRVRDHVAQLVRR